MYVFLFPWLFQFLLLFSSNDGKWNDTWDTKVLLIPNESQHQMSHITVYNRYPEIFQYVTEMSKKHHSHIKTKKILSFGCSIGYEVKTLSDLYFPNDIVDGIDYSTDIISKLQKENSTSHNHYYKALTDLIPKSYNVVFIMSVLFNWPEEMYQYPYPYSKFRDTLFMINKYVRLEGFIVIYNSKYRFTDISLYKNKCYEKFEYDRKKIKGVRFIGFNHTDPTGNPDPFYDYFMFKKLKDC